MIYTAIFTSDGNILKSKGKRPQYFNKFIVTQSLNENKPSMPIKIQGNHVHFVIKKIKNIKQKDSDESITCNFGSMDPDSFVVYLLIDSKKIENFSVKHVEDIFDQSEKLDFSIKKRILPPKKELRAKTLNLINNIRFLKIIGIYLKMFLYIFKKIISKLKTRCVPNKFTKEKLYTHLVSKNVSVHTVERIIDQLNTQYDDEDILFSKNEIKDLLVKNIKIYKTEDLLGEIKKKKGFVIGLVGPNGVGKSTSLSKLAYWLTSKKLKVLIVACDTFRAGAVEQLRKHANDLNVDLYERGYGKDENQVLLSALETVRCKNSKKRKNEDYEGQITDKVWDFNDAEKLSNNHESIVKPQSAIKINYGTSKVSNDYDVVIVDTSGRMHNNKKLIDQLRKMTKQMDHVIFVCEALVGGDGLDQLTVFKEFSNSLFLTKIDSCGEKVGSIVDMAGDVPILFFGVGQRRVDVVTDVETIVDLILN